MISCSDSKLDSIKGGEITLTGVLVVSALVVFISGIIDGIVNPERCGK